MSKRKICVVITARASYCRVKSVLSAISDHPDLDLQLVLAGSTLLNRYGNAGKFIEADGFNVAAKVFMVVEGENPVTSAKSTGMGLMELATVFDNLKPDIVITIADRYETLATAVAASFMNIPLAHIQGGEVTGSIDERVRHAVTKLSNYHFVSTEKSAERVIKMGEDPKLVFVTGCPSINVALQALKNSEINFDPFLQYGGVGRHLDLTKGYIIVTQHPVTTEYSESRNQVVETLYAVGDIDLPTLWFWPNVDAGSDGISKGIRTFREEEKPKNMHFFKHMAPEDFLTLILNSRCIVGNSSVGIRESSFLGVPTVNIGTRQRDRERGSNVIDVDYNREHIKKAIISHLNTGKFKRETLYGDGKAGTYIADHLAKVPLVIEKRITY